MRLILLCLSALAVAACGPGKPDIGKYDDAKLERLAFNGDGAAKQELARRQSIKDDEAAKKARQASIDKNTADEAKKDIDKKAYEAALAAKDETKLFDLADAGNPGALFWRSQKWLKSGNPVEAQQATYDVDTAARAGWPEAMLWVGFRMSQGVDGYANQPASGRDMVEAAAATGLVDAMYAAGQIYDYAGPLHSIDKARVWYQKAADAGLEAAKKRLEVLDDEAKKGARR
jgi:hypothetical protein